MIQLSSGIKSNTASLLPLTANVDSSVESVLVLDYVELVNFKSYAGVVKVGPFHKRLSAIVGPNGSGKSNIIDAMLFVFGRRAGQLRHKKLTGLIHSSANCQPTFASVKVSFGRCFQNDGVEVKREYAFSLSREINNAGANKYLIEGRTATHGEMVNFVKEQGIDLNHNRFLILQGEVEQLSMLPPKALNPNELGFLETLEDLIGTNELIPVIEELEGQYTDLKGALEESDSKVQRAEAELNHLLGPCQQAFGYIQTHRKLLTAKADLEAKERWKLVSDENIALANARDFTEQVQKCREESAEFKNELTKLLITVDKASREHASLLDSVKELTTLRDSARLEEDRLQTAIVSLGKRMREIKINIEDYQSEIVRKKEESVNIIEESQKCEAKLPELDFELLDVRTKLSKLEELTQDETAEINEKIRVLSNELTTYQKSLKDVDGLITEKKAILEVSEKTLNAHEEALKVLKEQQNGCREKIQEKITEMDHLALNRDCTSQSLKQLQERLKNDTARKLQLEGARKDLMLRLESSTIGGANSRQYKLYTTLKEQFESHNSSMYKMGFWLLDCVECDIEQHGPALTAGGLGEDIVVTENDENSERIIQFVKERRLGRVTCMTVATVSRNWTKYYNEWQKNQQTTFNGQVTYLMNIVKCSRSNLMPLLFSRLRDTLLCNADLEVAKKIAFGTGRERYKVVTLKGELIEKNGCMTGGSAINFLKQRSLPPPISSDQVSQLKDELKRIDTEHMKITNCVNTGTEEEQRLTRKYTETQKEMAQCIEDGKQLERRLLDLKSTYKARQTEGAKNEEDAAKREEIHVLNEQIALMNNKRAMLLREVEHREYTISAHREELKAVGGAARKQLNIRKNIVEKEIKTNSEFVANAIQMSSAAEQKWKLLENSSIPQAIQSLEAATHELAAKREQLNRVTEKEHELQKSINTQQKLLKTEEEKSVEAKRHKLQLENKLKTVRNTERELEERLQDLESHIITIRKNINQRMKVIDQLRIDFDELPSMDDKELQDLNQGNVHIEATENPDVDSRENLAPSVLQSDVMQENDLAITNAELTEDSLVPKNSSNKMTIIEFPNVEDEMRYANRPTSEFQLQLHKCDQLVRSLDTSMLDISILQKFQAKSAQVASLKGERGRRRDDLQTIFEEVQKKKSERRNMFEIGFRILSDKVKELYQMLTRGGDAELEFKDCNSPFTEGIEYSVRPPGKSWRCIQNLSGGEKTLSSLALIFALHHYKPTPIYFLDEIDAALDANNVLLIASYVSASQASNAQFVVISLRHEFFQRADRLVGVCKVNDRTRICVIDPNNFVKSNYDDVESRNSKKRNKPEPPSTLADDFQLVTTTDA